MKYFDWDPSKNIKLQAERGISFEDIETAIEEGYLVTTTGHPNQQKYPGQKMYLVQLQEYIYAVPFIEDQEKIFLKTIIPSRKMTRKYLKDKE